MALAAVDVEMEELPTVLVEMRPPRRCRGVHGAGEPAPVPDAPGAQHRVELRLLARGGVRISQSHFEADAVQRFLRNAFHGGRRHDAEQVVHRRGDVADVDVVVADLPVRGNTCGPGDDRGVGDPALVRGVALVQLVGGVERHRPTDRVMAVGRGAAEFVEEAHAVFHGVDVTVEELALVDRPVGPALAAGAVVTDDDDDGVVELAGLLEIVQDAADLRIGVGQETGEHLGHAGEQLLLLLAELIPRTHRVLLRPGLTVGAGDIAVGVDRGELGVRRDDAEPLLVLQHDLSVPLVTHVEGAGVAVRPFGEHMVGRMSGARADVGEPGFVRCDHRRITDEFDGPVGHVLGEVVTLLRRGGRLDRMAVVDQLRVPLVGLAAHEPVEPVEAAGERPVPAGGSEIGLFQRRQMPFSDTGRAVSAFGEHLRDQCGVRRNAAVDAGETLGELFDDRHADRGGVASRQQ